LPAPRTGIRPGCRAPLLLPGALVVLAFALGLFPEAPVEPLVFFTCQKS